MIMVGWAGSALIVLVHNLTFSVSGMIGLQRLLAGPSVPRYSWLWVAPAFALFNYMIAYTGILTIVSAGMLD